MSKEGCFTAAGSQGLRAGKRQAREPLRGKSPIRRAGLGPKGEARETAGPSSTARAGGAQPRRHGTTLPREARRGEAKRSEAWRSPRRRESEPYLPLAGPRWQSRPGRTLRRGRASTATLAASEAVSPPPRSPSSPSPDGDSCSPRPPAAASPGPGPGPFLGSKCAPLSAPATSLPVGPGRGRAGQGRRGFSPVPGPSRRSSARCCGSSHSQRRAVPCP